MNHGEEQRDELEALESIYFNEFKVISKKPPISFSIEVRLQATSCEDRNRASEEADDESDDDSEDGSEAEVQQQAPSVTLAFELPPKYPDVKPKIEIAQSCNLDEQDLDDLLELLEEKAQESLGTVMIFMLVSDVVEWLAVKGEREAEELKQEKDTKQKADLSEVKKCDGTPVTLEAFLLWKARFDAELLKVKLEKQKLLLAEQGNARRLTGREMFESDKTLAESDLNFVEDLDQSQIEALMHQIDEFEVDDNDEDEFETSDDDGEEEEVYSEEESTEEK